MRPIPRPPNEAERLAALREYAIFDTQPEPRFDDIVGVISKLFATPMAIISLINEDRHWTKAGIGYSGSMERDFTFCAHALLSDDLLVVEDATRDERFKDNPLVVPEDGVRFYAGAPLIVPGGHRLGTLCAVDTTPREADPQHLEILTVLARQVVELLEMRRKSSRLAETLTSVQTLGELIPICAHCRKVRDDRDYWSSLERFVGERTGARFARGVCPSCSQTHVSEVEPLEPSASSTPSQRDRWTLAADAPEQDLPALERVIAQLCGSTRTQISLDGAAPVPTFDPALSVLELALLTNAGERVGGLYLVDDEPRSLDDQQRAFVEAMSQQLVELAELRRVSTRLTAALSGVRKLGELIPVCADCQQVRDDKDYWTSLECHVRAQTGSRFSHGLCPECLREHYPEVADRVLDDKPI